MKKYRLAALVLFAAFFLFPTGLHAQPQNPFPGYHAVSFEHNGVFRHKGVYLGDCV